MIATETLIGGSLHRAGSDVRPAAGEEWASKETGLVVKIMKANDEVVWWENSTIWASACQTTLPEFMAAMKPTFAVAQPLGTPFVATEGMRASEGAFAAPPRVSNTTDDVTRHPND